MGRMAGGKACDYEINLSIKSKTIAPANQEPGFTVCLDGDDLKSSRTQMHIHTVFK